MACNRPHDEIGAFPCLMHHSFSLVSCDTASFSNYSKQGTHKGSTTQPSETHAASLHVSRLHVLGFMTAPLPTTSFGSGSPRRSSGGREVQVLSSPLKRAHSGEQSTGGQEDSERSEEDRNRPVKKLKQEITGEQGGEGLVSRLFKYAWYFVSGAVEGMYRFTIVEPLQCSSPHH